MTNPIKIAAPVRVACVGDSITEGYGIALPYRPYPACLQEKLGPGWEVGNFGVSGSTVLKRGDKPYREQNSFPNALDFRPDVIVIMLGTNDTKPHNWKFRDDFSADYRDLIGRFREARTDAKIFVCYPPPVAGEGNFGINAEGIDAEILLLQQLAAELGVEIIDVHGALLGREDLFPDRVHPNGKGAGVIAEAVFRSIGGKLR